MKDVRTAKVRTKNRRGKTVTSFVDAPLCEACKGNGFIPVPGRDVVDACPACNGCGEHRSKDAAYPQIDDDFQAVI